MHNGVCVFMLFALLALAGCRSHRPMPAPPPLPTDGLSDPFPDTDVQAVAPPPLGWAAQPLRQSNRHDHQIWISQTGRTAFGIIRLNLPLPVGPGLTLHGFLREMRRIEGESELLARWEDDALPGIRFVAEGGRYRLRANLITRGFTAWVIYAGTLRSQDELIDELTLAERAREATLVGLLGR